MDINISQLETPAVKVELSFSAKNLHDKDYFSKSDPTCIVYIKEKGEDKFSEIGRTETIKNELNPVWSKKFAINYKFEEYQALQFKVYDWDVNSTHTRLQDTLGTVECSLAEIMSHQGACLRKPLKNGGTLIINGQEITSNEIAVLKFSAKDLDKKDFFGKSDPFLVIQRQLSNEFLMVHKTEYVKNNLSPVWKPISLHVNSLCGGSDDSVLKILCYDWDNSGEHDLIGECQTTYKTLKRGSGSENTYKLFNDKKRKSGKSSGTLFLNDFSTRIEPSFLDYIRGGLQLHFTVAVDFTASNGDPQHPNSLHYWAPDRDNEYSLAIKSVGEIIQDYDSDKSFPALGFGAKIPPNWEVSHEFFLSGRSDPFCQGVNGVLEAYMHSLSTVRLYGPTNFTPVIRHIMQFAKSFQDGSQYFVLLIITDGMISDLESTKHALVEASDLPISIIIVGVGQEDFSFMQILDADNKQLSSGGVYAKRDIVQFVELRKYLKSGQISNLSKAALAQDVLAEIPKQLLGWMKSKNFRPKPPTVYQ